MFEKEAEKYVKVFTDRSYIWSNDKLMQLQLREAYKDGAKVGYNKANEWHKVSDKLPEMDDVVYLWHENERFPVCAYRHIPYGKSEKDWVWQCYWGSGYTITQSVAKDYWWKEIKLPKEVEIG